MLEGTWDFIQKVCVLWTWRRHHEPCATLCEGVWSEWRPWGQSLNESKVAWMRISTSKSEAMVLRWKRVKFLLCVGREVIRQVEEFKYLRVLFTSGNQIESEIDRQTGAPSAVMRMLNQSVVAEKELNHKAKLSIFCSILPADSYLWSWAFSQRMSCGYTGPKWVSFAGWPGSPLGTGWEVCFSHPWGAWSRAPSHREVLVETTQASAQDASWTPLLGGVSGMPHWEEAPGQIQDILDRQCLLGGWGTTWDATGREVEVAGNRVLWVSMLRTLPPTTWISSRWWGTGWTPLLETPY